MSKSQNKNNEIYNDAMRSIAFEIGQSEYERLFHATLNIAAKDPDHWMEGLNSFTDAMKQNVQIQGKTLNEITLKALFIASNGNRANYKYSI